MSRLKEVLRARLGNFVPSERRYLMGRDWKKSSDKGFEVAVIDPEAPSAGAVMEEARKFMIGTFYKEAVVPLALNLTADNDEMRSMLKKETDMYLNSGMSCTIRKSDTKELIGCTFFTTWKRDDDYEVVEDASLASWHNTAAEIAMEESPECPQAIWRHYQYQQLYNLAQKRMRDERKDFCWYVGLAFVKKEYRKLGGGAEFYPSIIEKVISENGMLIDTVTVEALLRSSKVTYGERWYNIADSMEYKEQKLAIGGKPIFEPFYKAGGICLIVPELK